MQSELGCGKCYGKRDLTKQLLLRRPLKKTNPRKSLKAFRCRRPEARAGHPVPRAHEDKHEGSREKGRS